MNRKGFTLVEILLTVILIGILISISILAINPQKQISDIRNADRRADIFSIYNAILQYREDNNGNLPSGIVNTITNICQVGCIESITQIDISNELNPYLRFNLIPIDPLQTGVILTGYTVYVNSQGRVIVSAPLAENGIIINTEE